MKNDLVNIMRCPECEGRFGIKIQEQKHNEIYKGSLVCEKCGREFPVVNYIPRLVADYNYSASWGELWKNTSHLLRDSFTQIPWHYDVIHGMHSEQGKGGPGASPFGFSWPSQMKGEKILEIGPGTGNCTEHLVNTGCNLLCVDMSGAVDTFPEELLVKPNLNVVQGDINSNFLPLCYFDRIWMFQVLQHTPSPKDTLKQAAKFLRKGGEMAVTSYRGHFNPWYYPVTKRINLKLSWKLIVFLAPVIVPVKYQLQKIFMRLKMPFFVKVARKLMEPMDPRNVYFNTLEGKANDYIMGIMWNRNHDKDLLMKYVVINTFDTITPKYTNCVPDDQTMGQWLKFAGFESFIIWGSGGVRSKAIQ